LGIEDLTQVQLIDGIMGLIYPAVGIIVGIIIASKYTKYKRKELLFVGISLIFAVISYLSTGITFIGMIFYNYVLDDTIFFLLYLGFGMYGTIFWMWAMAILIAPKHIKKIVGFYTIICIAFAIYVYLGIFMFPSWEVLVRNGPMDITTSRITQLFALFAFLSILISGLFFFRDTTRSGNARTIWKGRFIFTSIVLLTIGSLLISADLTDFTLILISRGILLGRIIFSYLGWIFPESVAKWLTKEDE
jgi:hypothetical protein